MMAAFHQAANSDSLKTSITYDSGDAKLFLPIKLASDIKEVSLIGCSSIDSSKSGAASCSPSLYYTNPKILYDQDNNPFITINERGVFLAQIVGKNKSWMEPDWLVDEYSQFVYNFASPSDEINLIAERYNPSLSFHEGEKYFPVSIDSIFDLEISEFSDTNIEYTEDGSTKAKDVLSKYADLNYYAYLNKDSAKKLSGEKSKFSNYYLYEQIGDSLWITYIYFFGYDEKSENSPANHELDRESVTIKFSKTDAGWAPDGIIYAGHLPTQPTDFVGNSESGSKVVTWSGGKTFVKWNNASRNQNGSPIVYVARGSHAMFPALGWYEIVNSGPTPNLKEPAGSGHNGIVGELQYLDISSKYGLVFSGNIINGLGGGAKNSKFFPFVRNPIQSWAEGAGLEFSECVENKSGCENYINLPDISKPSYSINFDQATLTALGASGSNYTLFTGKDGRPAVKFAGVSNPGFMKFPNHTSMWFTTGGTFDFWARIDSNTGMNGYGQTVTGGWAMSLLAKSHDRTGVALNTYPADSNYSGDGYGFASFSTYDTTWSSGDPPCVVVKRNPGNPLGSWFRMTAVASSLTGTQIYVNKELVAECPGARPQFATMNSQDLYIGRYSEQWYPLDGAIQDVRIYNKALSAAEVSALQ